MVATRVLHCRCNCPHQLSCDRHVINGLLDLLGVFQLWKVNKLHICGGGVGGGFRYPPQKPWPAHGLQTVPQIHHTTKETFVSSFTHSQPCYHPSVVSQPLYWLVRISQDQESAINKNRPDKILLFYLCLKKVHECSYIIQGFFSCVTKLSFLTSSHIRMCICVYVCICMYVHVCM